MLDDFLHYPDGPELQAAFDRLTPADQGQFFEVLRAALWPQTAGRCTASARIAAAKRLEALLERTGTRVELRLPL